MNEWVHVEADFDQFMAEQTRDSGVIVIDSLPKIIEAVVLGYGDGVKTKQGVYGGSELQIGDKVMFKREARNLMGDERNFMVKENDILGVII